MTVQTTDRQQVTGYVLALGAAACVGFTPVASKGLLAELHVATFGVIWFGCAGAYAVALLLAQGRGRDLVLRGRVFVGAALVGVSNALAGLLFFRAVQLTDPALVAFFTRPGTILTVLAGVVFFGERLRRSEWMAVWIVLGGSLLMGVRSDAVQLHAFVIVVANTVLTSASYTLAKGAVANVKPLPLVAYRACFSSATYVVVCAFLGEWTVPAGAYLWALPVGAFLGPFVSFLLLFRAFERLTMSRATVVHSIYPVFTTLYSLLLFGAGMRLVQFLGGLLATAGIALLVAQKPDAATASGDPKAE